MWRSLQHNGSATGDGSTMEWRHRKYLQTGKRHSESYLPDVGGIKLNRLGLVRRVAWILASRTTRFGYTVPNTGIPYDLVPGHVVCFDLKISVREGFLNLKKYPSFSLFLFPKAFEHFNAFIKHGASFLNRARNSRCTVITDLDTSKRSTQKAFSCCDAIFETGPVAPH